MTPVRWFSAWRAEVAWRRECAASAAHARALVAAGNPYSEVLTQHAERCEAVAQKVQL